MPTTRYYLPSSPAGAAAAPVSPAFGTLWQVQGTGSRCALVTAPADTSDQNRTLSETLPGSAYASAPYQYVGPALAAGLRLDAVKVTARTSTGTTGTTTYLAARIALVSNDGATVRAELFAGHGGAVNSALFTATARQLDVAVPGVVTQAGDRLVVEVGLHIVNTTSASAGGAIRLGDPTAQGDLAVGATTAGRPWVDLTYTIPPEAPTGLAVTALTPSTATLGWTAPAAGAAPTSYELRVNAGAPLDVGLVTTHQLTGLAPGSTHTAEVRTIAAGVASAWAGPVTFTTPAPVPARPWLVSEVLLARAGADPEADQPAFLWLDHDGAAFGVAALRSRALMGWQITTGRADVRGKVPPSVVTVTLAAWGDYATAGLPELGHRFRLALSPALTALGIAAGDLPRFTGEVTDVDLDPRTRVLTVTGVGRYARQSRLPVDGTGWPVEREGARVGRVLAAIGAEPGTLDPGRVDLAAHAAAGTAQQAVDTVSDSTTGQLVERRDGALDWHDADHRRDAVAALTLDAGELLRGFRWAQRVGDLTNAATVKWAAGEVRVEDTASVTARGTYPTSLDTLLTNPAAAQSIGGLIVGRYGRPVWLLPAVMLDLTRTLDPAELPAGVGLTHGDKVQLIELPAGGPYTERGAYVEGVTETLTPRAWRLTLTVADEQLAGAPLRWRDVPDAVRWTDARDGLRWLDVATIQDPADLTT